MESLNSMYLLYTNLYCLIVNLACLIVIHCVSIRNTNKYKQLLDYELELNVRETELNKLEVWLDKREIRLEKIMEMRNIVM